MSEDVEWGPWVEHDGRGCPLPVGTMIEAVYEWRVGCFCTEVHPVPRSTPSWDWRNWGRPYSATDPRLVMALRRYRIRKPRALLDLIRLAEHPYAPPPVIAPEGPVRAPGRQPDQVQA